MMDTATAARAIAAKLSGPNVLFSGVTTDSRALKSGELFVALKGERFDGHDFVAQAFDGGAVAAIVADERASAFDGRAGASLLAVADPLTALGALAAYWRRRFTLPVIAIVGSNGKTTVKEMATAVLRAQFGNSQVLATAGNLNNQIGLPLSVLGLRASHRVAALEIGMNHRGETATLAAIAQPTIALINNAQREHQEFMRSVAEVAAEHASLLNVLPDHGVAVINADDSHAGLWRDVVDRRNAEGASVSVLDVGLSTSAAISARYRAEDWGSIIDVETPAGATTVELRAPGRHNVSNALAAIAAATAAGVGLDAVRNGLAAFRPVAGRLEAKTGVSGVSIIDDTYNANPDSARAAIAVLAKARGARWLVLGDMGEVGDAGPSFHREIGEYARTAGIERLFAVGVLTAHSAAAFGANARHYNDVDSLIAALRNQLASEQSTSTTLLIKGSRFMRMERVVAGLGAGTPVRDVH